MADSLSILQLSVRSQRDALRGETESQVPAEAGRS